MLSVSRPAGLGHRVMPISSYPLMCLPGPLAETAQRMLIESATSYDEVLTFGQGVMTCLPKVLQLALIMRDCA